MDCLNRYYNGDKLSMVMYKITIIELKNLEMFYESYFKKEYELCKPDFALISAIKSIYEHRYKHNSFEYYIDTILAKEVFSLKI
jgi:hypothetical protein